jgi:hypothetical protein
MSMIGALSQSARSSLPDLIRVDVSLREKGKRSDHDGMWTQKGTMTSRQALASRASLTEVA